MTQQIAQDLVWCILTSLGKSFQHSSLRKNFIALVLHYHLTSQNVTQ